MYVLSNQIFDNINFFLLRYLFFILIIRQYCELQKKKKIVFKL